MKITTQAQQCQNCGAVLSKDEIAFYKKMYKHDATLYSCVHCMAQQLGYPETQILAKIEQLKKVGCVFFLE